MRKHHVLWSVLATFMIVGLLLSGCAGISKASEDPGAGSADSEGVEEPTVEVEPKDYGVPADDANIINPIAADNGSLQRGEEIYSSSCVKCHGEEGRGDGAVGAILDPKPVDFRAEHVKELSDGELFYITTHGVEGTGMLAFTFFEEEDRWHLVNYMRTFQE